MLPCLNCLIFLICNHVHTHSVHRFKQTEREKQLFSLKGSDCCSQRMAIYSFLLSHMTDAHRFQLTAKLCQEVQEHTNMYMYMFTQCGSSPDGEAILYVYMYQSIPNGF